MGQHYLLEGNNLHYPLGALGTGTGLNGGPRANAALDIQNGLNPAYAMEDGTGREIFGIDTSATVSLNVAAFRWCGAGEGVYGDYTFVIAAGYDSIFLIEDQNGNNFFEIDTGATDRITLGGASNPLFRWTGTGEWQFGGSAGTSGYVLTSNGAGAAPTWQAAGISGLGNQGTNELLWYINQDADGATTEDAELRFGGSSSGDAHEYRHRIQTDFGNEILHFSAEHDTSGNGTFIPSTLNLHIGYAGGNSGNARTARLRLYSTVGTLRYWDYEVGGSGNLTIVPSTTGRSLNFGNTSTTPTFAFNIADNNANSYEILQNTTQYFNIRTSDNSESIFLGNDTIGRLELLNETTGQNSIRQTSDVTSTTEGEWFKSGEGQTTAGGGTVDLITIALPSDVGAWFEVHAVGRESGAGTASRVYHIVTGAENDSGTAAVIGTASIDSEQGDSLGSGDITVVFSGANVIVRATADATLVINWSATVIYGMRGGA